MKIIDDLHNDKKINTEQLQAIFNYTKSEACQNNCPQEIPLIKLYDWARHKIQTNHRLRNDKQYYLIQNIVNTDNPFGHEKSRLEGVFLELLKAKIDNEFEPLKTKILLHIGCMLGYRLNSMRDDKIKIFNLLDIDYALLKDENCCGYFIWNTGDHKTAKELIDKNSQDFDKFDKVICACTGCYTFFKEYYPDSEKFYHSIEIIEEPLIRAENEGRLHSNQLVETISKSMIFHDSCPLTRPHNIIIPPRRLLHLIGCTFKEYPHYGKNGLCCGADGGLRIVNPELAVKIGLDRVKEAKDMGSDIIITLCPFCIFNFRDATLEEDKIEVHSLYYYIREYLELNLKEK